MINLCSPREVAELLRSHGIELRRDWGQNLLVDRNVLNRIVEAADIKLRHTVIEVGCGLGTLTAECAVRAGRVIAIEKDAGLAAVAEELVPDAEVRLADVRDVDFAALLRDTGPDVLFVANLPYHVSKPLLQLVSDARHGFERVVVMVQKEVAERVMADPGSGDYGLLAIACQLDMAVEWVMNVSRNCFLPAPSVDSVVIRLSPRQRPRSVTRDEVMATARMAFATRRKKMLTTLTRCLPGATRQTVSTLLESAGIDPDLRPEQIAIPDFIRLAERFQAAGLLTGDGIELGTSPP